MAFLDKLDKLDIFLTDARGRGKAKREAAKFERACKPGVSYFSIEECQQPWGNEPRAREWVFKKGLLGSLSCGPHSPAYIWLNYGPLMESPGNHIEKLFANATGQEPSEADQKKLLDAILTGVKATQKELEKV